MLKTPKSRLLEYHQANQFANPIYCTDRVGGQPHNPEFQSTVRFLAGSSTGQICGSISAAEHSAAEKALASLGVWPAVPEVPAPPLPLNNRYGRTICIIDYENQPGMLEVVQKYASVIDTIYLVLGDHHHKAEQEFPGTIKLLCPSMAPNAVDLCITMLVGSLLRDEQYDFYILVSRDKFVSTVLEMITKPTLAGSSALWSCRQAIVATREAHLAAAFN